MSAQQQKPAQPPSFWQRVSEPLKRAWGVTRAAYEEDRNRVKTRRNRHELEFLPAALEVIETPPSPTVRATIWLIIAAFVIAIAWATFSKTDVVVTATGKVIPSSRSKVIQPLEQGIIRAIHVEEGQRVKKGDVLVELDPTETGAEKEQVRANLNLNKLEMARLQALIDDPENPESKLVVPEGASATEIQTQLQLLRSQVEERRARLAGLENDIAQAQAEREGVAQDVNRLQRTLPLILERAQSQKELADKQLAPRSKALELQQDLVEVEQNLKTQRSRLRALDEQIASKREERNRFDSEFRSQQLTSLQETQAKVSSLTQELLKATERFGNRVLTAPTDGTVQQLAITTIGGVVKPAENIMVVVPDNDALEIEALLLNKDRGGVTVGDTAAVKVEAFPFTRYGTIPGVVKSISSDSIQNEQLGPVFKVIANLERNTLKSRDEVVNLTPGMAVTLEIKTDERRIIAFVLSPIIKGFEEAARER